MLQEEANVQMAGWVSYLQECKVGCFILDPPMGLGKNALGWSLCDIMKTINVIDVSFGGEFTIILYSMYSMVSVQDALTEEPMTDRSRLSVSRFTLAKVKSYWSFKSVKFGPSVSCSGQVQADSAVSCLHRHNWFLMAQDTFNVGRSGPGSHTSTHLLQDVLIIQTNRARLDLTASGLDPFRFFAPSTDTDDVATGGTYVFSTHAYLQSSVFLC